MQDFNLGMGLDKFTADPAAPSGGMGTTMYQNRRNQISSMPPGPQKEAALAALLRDYKGETEQATAAREQGFAEATHEAPGGQQIGGRYATYVAAHPLEHLASGVRRFQGVKEARSAKDQLKKLSEQQQKAREDMFRAGMGGGTQYGMYNRP